MKKKYAFAGASNRAIQMFAVPMVQEYAEYTEIAGVFDANAGRCQAFSRAVGGAACYDSFDEMIEKEQPDAVIVTTVDAYHSDFIIRALELGCEVITEKPMTIDAARCRAILEAEEKYSGKVRVTFNYRYAPFMTKIKQLIQQGSIGRVYSVHFEWLLDSVMELGAHGASYFRRWNSQMEKSGGLLVHKSTHHFDLVNWWIDDEPQAVSAFGRLNAYGAENSSFSWKKCENCPHAGKCEFYYELNDWEKELYRGNEKYDGYYKDRCVYSEKIDIYDTMSVNVLYKKGAMMSYSLNATTPYEGWRVAVNGSLGRLEAFFPETGIQAECKANEIRVFDRENNCLTYEVTKAAGGHGGGDKRLLDSLFIGVESDPLGHEAGTGAGANSILIGAAANLSIAEGRMVKLEELQPRK